MMHAEASSVIEVYCTFSKLLCRARGSPRCSFHLWEGCSLTEFPKESTICFHYVLPAKRRSLTSEFPGISRRTSEGPPDKSVGTCPVAHCHGVALSEIPGEGLEAQEGKGLAVTCLKGVQGSLLPQATHKCPSVASSLPNCKTACSRPPRAK